MKGKIRIIAKFHRTDLVICSHSRERKPPSYSRRNTVYFRTLLACHVSYYHIVWGNETRFLQNQSQKFRSILYDGPRFLGGLC